MVDVRLITFLTLLEEKSYTKTAKKLYITQPAVTHHIKSLEKEKDIIIFKDNKSFELTQSGILLKEYATIAKQQYLLFENALNRQSETVNTIMAVTPTAASYFKMYDLNKILDIKTLNLHIYKYDYNSIVNGLLDGTIDFAIIDNSFDSYVFDSFTLKTANIILVCSPNGKYNNKDRITREQLSSATIITSEEDSGLCKSAKNSLANKNIKLKKNIIIQSNSTQFMVEQILSYDGIGFMYESQAKDYIDSGKLKKIELLNFQATQNIYLMYNRTSFLDKNVIKLIENIKKY